MPLDFPSNPAPNQTWYNHYYDATKGAWRSLASGNTPNSLVNSTITTSNYAAVPLTVKGTTSQSANLQEWKNISGTTVASIDSSGNLYSQNIPLSQNYLLNSAFDIWQRGAGPWTPSGTYIYTADRWAIYRDAGVANYSAKQLTTLDTLPSGAKYAIRVQRTAGDTGTSMYYLGRSFEGSQDIVPLQGQTITVSFYLRIGANFSGSGGFKLYFETGTGADTAFTVSPSTPTTTYASLSATTSWVRYSYNFTIPATHNTGRFFFQVPPTGTAGVADYFDIWGMQLELGNTATPFRRNQPSLQSELAACQRYYEIAYGTCRATTSGGGYLGAHFSYKATKRISVQPGTISNGAVNSSNFGFDSYYGTTAEGTGVQFRRTAGTDGDMYNFGFSATVNAEL